MMRKTISALLCALLLCLTLAACGRGEGAAASAPGHASAPARNVPQVHFAAGDVSADTTELRLPLAAGETALLASLPQLHAADFSGSADETEIVTGDFSADQISLFSEFDGLRRVDATACSDQGVHYTAHAYRAKLKELRLAQSMSRRACCRDNAPIESFRGRMKEEIGP